MIEEKKDNPSRPLSSYESREIDWLWNSRIPIGCVTLMSGDGGVGKSSIIAALGAAISSGKPLPDDVSKPPSGVLLLAAEDDPSVVLRPRFEANGANLDLVRCFDQSMLLNLEGLQKLEYEIFTHTIRLVVIDPVVAFLGQTIDPSKAGDVRSIMTPLHELAKHYDCAIVVVRHFNKSTNGLASHKGSGSVDWRNACRSELQVIKGTEHNFLTLEKSNYGVTGKTLTFKLNNKVVEWTGTSELNADELLREQIGQSHDSKSELSEAITFLEEELRDGPVLSSAIQKNANDFGISNATLRRARNKLGVTAKKMPGRNSFYSYLPHQVPAPIKTKPDDAHVFRREEHDHHEPHLDQLEIASLS